MSQNPQIKLVLKVSTSLTIQDSITMTDAPERYAMLPNYGVRVIKINESKMDDIIIPTSPLEYIDKEFDFGFCKVLTSLDNRMFTLFTRSHMMVKPFSSGL